MSATDWDLYWRMERLHRRFEPVDFRRWKRASQVALRAQFPGDGVRLLDATAGLGDHTVNLAELGFVVDACDASAEARDATRDAVRTAGVAVDVFDARWESLGDARPGRYDLIFHDAIHWVETPGAMHAALAGLRGALRDGGALVFFFADPQEPEPGAGRRVLDWDRAHVPLHELCWSHAQPDGARVTHVRMALAHDDVLDEHLLYLTESGAAPPRLDSTILRRVYAWDWHAMTAALRRAGFGDIRGARHVNDKGHPFAMNLAFR